MTSQNYVPFYLTPNTFGGFFQETNNYLIVPMFNYTADKIIDANSHRAFSHHRITEWSVLKYADRTVFSIDLTSYDYDELTFTESDTPKESAGYYTVEYDPTTYEILSFELKDGEPPYMWSKPQTTA